MKPSPVLNCFSEDSFEFGRCGELTVALRAKQLRSADLYLADLSALRKFLVVGNDAAAWLGAQGFTFPQWFKRVIRDDGHWATKIGHSRYLVSEGTHGAGQSKFVTEQIGDEVLVLPQDSVELVCGGLNAARLLNEFCAIELESTAMGDWTPVLLCQLDIGVYRQANEYHLVCAPADAQFLFETLADAVTEQGGAVIGFEDYQHISTGELA